MPADRRGAPIRPGGLRAKYEVKAKRLRDQLMAAQAKVDEYGAAAQGDLLSTAGTLLGSFLGGRRNRAPSPVSRASEPRRAASREAAADKAATIEQDAAELEDALAATGRDRRCMDGEGDRRHRIPMPLERTDVAVTNLALVWIALGLRRPVP